MPNYFANWQVPLPPVNGAVMRHDCNDDHSKSHDSQDAVGQSTTVDSPNAMTAAPDEPRAQRSPRRGLKFVGVGTGLGSWEAVREMVPDAPVQAVADYSVGYSKQVFFGVIAAAKKWVADDASTMAAGVAYYLALSLFPMLLLLTAGLGLVFRYTSMGHDAELQILHVVGEHCSDTLKHQVEEVLSQLREQSLVGGPFGLVTAIMAAIGVFYRFERAFDCIWNCKPPQDSSWWHAARRILKQRLSAFCLLASVGLAIMMILVVNIAVSFLQGWMVQLQLPGSGLLSGIDACLTLMLNAVVFALLYRWLPKRRIYWSEALRGGLLAAIVWEVGRQLLGAVLIGVRYTSAYGAIGSFIALLLWCYWGVSIIFFGAEYAQVLSDQRRERHKIKTQDLSTVSLVNDPAPQTSHRQAA